MTDRGWGLSEQHLMPDAVVAFVDGELSPTAWDRASSHVARCPYCAADVAAQRQARAAVQEANNLAAPDWLLASLRAIPEKVEVPTAPDGLAMTDDGQLVAVQRPDRVAPLGASAPLGSSPKLGEGRAVLGWRLGKRTVSNSSPRWRSASQGAGVVVSGLVLGALALANSGSSPAAGPADSPSNEVRPAVDVNNIDLGPVGLVADAAAVLAPR